MLSLNFFVVLQKRTQLTFILTIGLGVTFFSMQLNVYLNKVMAYCLLPQEVKPSFVYENVDGGPISIEAEHMEDD